LVLIETSNLLGRLIVASYKIILRMTYRLWKGRGHVTWII